MNFFHRKFPAIHGLIEQSADFHGTARHSKEYSTHIYVCVSFEKSRSLFMSEQNLWLIKIENFCNLFSFFFLALYIWKTVKTRFSSGMHNTHTICACPEECVIIVRRQARINFFLSSNLFLINYYYNYKSIQRNR